MCAKNGLSVPQDFDESLFLLDGWPAREKRVARRLKKVTLRHLRRPDKRLGMRHMSALWEEYCLHRRHSILSRMLWRCPAVGIIEFPATRIKDPYTGQEYQLVLTREEGDAWDWHCCPRQSIA